VWIAIAMGLVLLAVGVLVTVLLLARRSGDVGAGTMSPDDLVTLGIVFVGAGVALSVTIGPFMIWMVGLGLAYMAMGRSRKHHE
jgi:hypothetical protein